MKTVLRIVGQATDGKDVVAGVFRFFETEGLPLDVLFDAIMAQNAVPDWGSFYGEALAAGMAPERIFAKLDPALSDVYGPAYRDVVIGRLRAMPGPG